MCYIGCGIDMFCFMQSCFKGNNFVATLQFFYVNFHCALIYSSCGMWRMEGNVPPRLPGCHTWLLRPRLRLGRFTMYLRNRMSASICKTFAQKNMWFQILVLYVRLKSRGKRFSKHKELRRRAGWARAIIEWPLPSAVKVSRAGKSAAWISELRRRTVTFKETFL